MTKPLIKIVDVAYPRLRVPDLDRMEEFLRDFGMVRSARTDSALYMRGSDDDHHLHVSEVGEPGLTGFAVWAHSMQDLETIATAADASDIHEINEPGGGYRVTLTDPDGFVVEVVHGIERLEPLGWDVPLPLNTGTRVERVRTVQRVQRQPAHVKRLGHVGMNVRDLAQSFNWYHAHFGILKSDTVELGGTEFALFCRCDRGDTPTDHHTILLAKNFDDTPSLNHMSWEVRDIDDVHLGHEHLAAKGYVHNWGIGRHTLGSQVFDYWRDPWGQIHEHFTDGDLLDVYHPASVHGPEDAGSQWGPQMPADFGRAVS